MWQFIKKNSSPLFRLKKFLYLLVNKFYSLLTLLSNSYVIFSPFLIYLVSLLFSFEEHKNEKNFRRWFRDFYVFCFFYSFALMVISWCLCCLFEYNQLRESETVRRNREKWCQNWHQCNEILWCMMNADYYDITLNCCRRMIKILWMGAVLNLVSDFLAFLYDFQLFSRFQMNFCLSNSLQAII